MNEELYNITELPITANEGWKEMQALLNQHLPANSQMIYRKMLLSYGYVAIILVLLLLTTLRLDNSAFHLLSGSAVSPLLPVSAEPAKSLTALTKNNRLLNLYAAGNISSQQNNSGGFPIDKGRLLPAGPHPADELLTPNDGITENIRLSVSRELIEKKAGDTVHAHINISRATVVLAHRKADDRTTVKGSWNLFGGLGINASIGSNPNLQPYPVAEARYNLNSTTYFGAGLSAWSPVSAGTAGVSKVVYLNDSLASRNFYNEITSYHHLRYADIPLFVGMNIGKNISVQGGIQASVLLNKKTSRVITGPVNSPLSVTATNLQQEYGVQTRSVDYRFIAGVRYALSNTVIGVTYQHGLQSIGSGTYTENNRNHILALSVLFKLK